MSGKSQFATKFSTKFRAPQLNFESIPGITRKTALDIITQIAKSTQNLVIDEGLDTFKQREELRNLLTTAGYQSILVWVQTDINAVKRRLRTQLKSADKARTYFEKKLNQLEAPETSEHPIVISGRHTFEGQLKSVLSALSKAS